MIHACDAAGIASIYHHHIERTVVTFEEQPVSAEEMARRRREVEEAALPHDASVALHEKFGMKQVASFKELDFKFDPWIDVGYVGYWQATR